MIRKPTQHEMYSTAIDEAISGAIRIEISHQYYSSINVAQILEFRDQLEELYFLKHHECERADDLIRVYKVPEAYSILRVNQLHESPLIKFAESEEVGLVRCLLE